MKKYYLELTLIDLKKHVRNTLLRFFMLLIVVFGFRDMASAKSGVSQKIASASKDCITETVKVKPVVSTNTIFIDETVQQPQTILNVINKSDQFETFNIFSHGRPGELFIEGKWLNKIEIAQWLHSKKQFNNSNSAQLNIYGCEFAKEEKGLKAVTYLENTLGVKVAASNNITGIDGDWKLEVGGNNTSIGLESYAYNLQDTDNDGIPDTIDIDDDNDGI
ncbi:MAG: DUF4347 domain-containing protein, partial [Bacteroidales bacterium]|nr:DUF4347 domain-containing protein [Bacteroidales bacterium]